jgi:hypothetical protein
MVILICLSYTTTSSLKAFLLDIEKNCLKVTDRLSGWLRFRDKEKAEKLKAIMYEILNNNKIWMSHKNKNKRLGKMIRSILERKN